MDQTPQLLIVRDAEGNSDYDAHYLVPATMPLPEAIALADATIEQLKRDHPEYEGYEFDEALRTRGLTPLTPGYATERW